MYYLGHKNPDTDSIAAAIAAAQLYGGTPARAGELNKETDYVINLLGFPLPELITDATGKEIALIDHNQKTQTVDNIDKAKITKIIDHHALQSATVVFDYPIEVTIRPYGSSCTIVAEEFFRQGHEIPEKIAQLMLLGILSDTLALESPTTSAKDKEMVKLLMEKAGLTDHKPIVKEMFKAKSDVSKLSASEILNLDYKEFEFNGKKVGFGVAETVAPEDLLVKKMELIEALKAKKTQSNLNYIYFAIIDILNKHSDLLVIDAAEQEMAERLFGGKTANNVLDIGSRISRKKELIPPISEYLNK